MILTFLQPVQALPHQTLPNSTTSPTRDDPQELPIGIFDDQRYYRPFPGSSEAIESTVESGSLVQNPSIERGPSLRFSQDTWWDTVLSVYDPNSKLQAAHLATAELLTFFRTASAWICFINVPLFFSMFYDPEQRSIMQPALVLGCLAYSAYVQGSEREGGELQRRKALKLRDLGQAAFDASYNAGWIDTALAQASWVSRTRPCNWLRPLLTHGIWS